MMLIIGIAVIYIVIAFFIPKKLLDKEMYTISLLP
jgi:hypothetical protein